MKNKTWIISLIVLLSLIAITLLVFMILFINGNFKMPFIHTNYKISKELIVDNKYDNVFEEINIDSTFSEIYIKESNDSNIRILIYGNKDKINIIDDKLILKINIKDKCNFFCINKLANKVEIYLPKEYDKKINISNNLGNIEIEEFLNANINIKEDYGDVFIRGGNNIDVDNSLGDIKIEQAKKTTVNASAGDVEIGIVEDVIVHNSLGDIRVDEVTNYLNLTNNCGDIKVKKLNINKDSFINSDLGDVKINNTNEIYIDAKTSLGDVKIDNNYNKSDITLKITNNLGDIKVDN